MNLNRNVPTVLALLAITLSLSLFSIVTVNARETMELAQAAAQLLHPVDPGGPAAARRQWRINRLRLQTEQGTVAPAASAASSSSSLAPCAVSSSSSSAASQQAVKWLYEDLSTTQKAELERQLDIGGCPQTGTDAGYRLLCEDLLRTRLTPAQRRTRTGPRNSLQP